MSQNYINHIALVLDASSSMTRRTQDLIKVADDQIAYLARRSTELDQETRITVYTFADSVQCVIFDKDVLRLPSIREFYKPYGWTALIDATLQSQIDLSQTAQMYGDHAFLTYVLTDGEENRSRKRSSDLSSHLNSLPDNWTVAVLVPSQQGKFEAKKFGFPAENIAIWDTTSSQGLFEAGNTILVATDQFMVNRSQGIRGSRSMFSTGADAVNKRTIQAAGLGVLPKNTYVLMNVDRDNPIREWVEGQGRTYSTGCAYYQLSKTETIQPSKKVAVVEKGTGNVYTGTKARDLIGLPTYDIRVKPDFNPDFDVFVQSTSVNRKLIAGTRLLLLT